MPLYVTKIDEGSPAQKLGLSLGCALLAVDGHPLNDALDYQFYTTPAAFSLDVCENEQHRTIQVQKGEYEPLGCNFKTYLGDEKHSCSNHCMFCFIDQLPPGMRAPLYFKDDDERLSFLFGNYITLTNLTDHEIDRIIQMHISPIFVSVHTTNPELRVRMLANKRGGEVLKYLPKLATGGIELNCQLVLCRGINDGDELRRTLTDLLALRPQVVAHLRDAIVQEISRQRAARARVDLHALIERVAHALRDAALELTGDGQAVDGRADVHDLNDIQKADGVEFLVVFRLDKADGERVGAGQSLVGARADGHAALGVEQDLARGVLKAQLKLLAAADIVAVVLFLDRAAVVDDLELLDHLLFQIVAGELDGVAADKRLARTERAGVIRRQARVRRGDLHAGEGDTEAFRRDLALHRLAALTDIGRADEQMHGRVGVEHDDRAAQALL